MGILDLNQIPLLLTFLASVALILVASEIGRLVGLLAHRRGVEHVSTLSSLQGAIFGLLALMIAFTFGMALSRFEARRDAVLNEANTIGTTALRARLLPAPHNAEALKLLKAYIGLRLDLAKHVMDSAQFKSVVARSDAIQEAWQETIAAARFCYGSISLLRSRAPFLVMLQG